MRAAFLNTEQHTGFNSLSDFINAAVNEKVASLEEVHNQGRPWAPIGAREIPLGKPSGRRRPHEVRAAKEKLREHGRLALWDFVEKVRAELAHEFSGGRGEVNVYYSIERPQAVVVTHDATARASTIRHYDAEGSYGELWLHISTGQGWDDGGSLPAGPRPADGGDHLVNGGRQTPAPELMDVVEKARGQLEQAYSGARGDVTVFYSPDGLQALVETYDIGYKQSSFTGYDYDAALGLIRLRTSTGRSWEDGGTTPYSA